MKSQDMILSIMRAQGKADALSLRERASEMDGTAIIAEENKIPAFDPEKDYTGWPQGSPVQDDGQVYGLLQPYNASTQPGQRPKDLPALWSIKHTKDPARAKPWVAPQGIGGIYSKDECCTDPNAEDPTTVYRSKEDNNAFSPSAYPNNWEVVE